MADPDAKKVIVDVHLDLHNEPPFYFTTNDLPLDPPHHLYFKNGKKEGFKVCFDLKDPDNVYSFGTDKKEALYSTEAPGCPDQAGQWPEFRAVGIENGGMRLVVHNLNKGGKNGGSMDFGYTLRIKKNGESYRNLDPVGTNQNNNSANVVYSAAVTFLVLGAAVGGLVAAFAMSDATQASILSGAVVGAIVGLGAYFLTRGGMQRTA